MNVQGVCAGGGDDAGIVDLLVIGAGINGAGIARDAAGRGLRVVLCERADLAQGTSSRSSGLIHGGLRYLEYGEFSLVRAALREREVLLETAGHLVRPMNFVLPHVPQMRPAWMLRLGLVLYDHLAKRRRLPASRSLALGESPEGAAVRPHLRLGFCYSDCRTDDARLVVHNAIAAHALGAQIRTRTEFVEAVPAAGCWQILLRPAQGGAPTALRARALVNAAGPWVEPVGRRIAGVRPARAVRLVKGSHLVVAKFWEGGHAYLLQNTDRRVIFVTPYEDRYALIGTTDIHCAGMPEDAAIVDDEVRYLCDAVNRQLRCELGPADVLHTFSGVRCLVDAAQTNASALSRDYVLDLAAAATQPPLLTVLGGKITTYRRLAEEALGLLAPHFPGLPPDWTAHAALPGAEFPGGDFALASDLFVRDHAFLPREHALGLMRRHGSNAGRLLSGIGSAGQMGRHFGAGLYERELRHFLDNEWAAGAEDVLWRRTKFGLRLGGAECRELSDWIERLL